MKIKSIIVDDEKHGRENLAGILRQYCPNVGLQTKMLSGFEPLSALVLEIYTYAKKKSIQKIIKPFDDL